MMQTTQTPYPGETSDWSRFLVLYSPEHLEQNSVRQNHQQRRIDLVVAASPVCLSPGHEPSDPGRGRAEGGRQFSKERGSFSSELGEFGRPFSLLALRMRNGMTQEKERLVMVSSKGIPRFIASFLTYRTSNAWAQPCLLERV